MASPHTALVVCGGGPVLVPWALPPAPDVVIAADDGAREALRLGLEVDVVVGDMDSVPASTLVQVERSGGRVMRHPVDKDATDLELALDEALTSQAQRIVVAGGAGGRLDFVLANALALGHPRLAAAEVDAVFGIARLHVVRGERALDGTPGEVLSLLAVDGPAAGVRTHGLRWTLDGQDLPAASGWGVSNEFALAEASVSIEAGVVLVVRPGEVRDA
jgi:thiamine pyrophosphokinase